MHGYLHEAPLGGGGGRALLGAVNYKLSLGSQAGHRANQLHSAFPLVIYRWGVSVLVNGALLEGKAVLMPEHAIHLFNQYLLNIYYIAGTVLSTEDIAPNKTGQNLCHPGAHILAGEKDDKQKKCCICFLLLSNTLLQTSGPKQPALIISQFPQSKIPGTG